MLAFVLAIGMSFAFTNANNAVITGWIDDPQGGRQPVNVDCVTGNFDCKVHFESDPFTEYPVYASETSNEVLESSSPDAYEIPDPE